MSGYIAELKSHVEQESARRAADAKAQGAADAALTRDRLTPLEVRLARLLSTIPIEVQREGLSLASLQAGLRGRWRGSCHPGELGLALRRLGFERRRQWRAGTDSFGALWYLVT